MRFDLFTRYLGIALLVLGVGLLIELVSFVGRSETVAGTVVGYSAIQQLDRERIDCSAYSKSCGVEVSYRLSNGSEHSALLSQPLFGRSKVASITLLVDPADPSAPRIASLNILARNTVFLIVLGAALFGLSFALRMKPHGGTGGVSSSVSATPAGSLHQ